MFRAEKECEKEPDGETLTEDQEEVISPLPSSWRAANDLKEYAETKIEEATFGRRDSVTSSCTPLGSSIPKEILHPTFATGTYNRKVLFVYVLYSFVSRNFFFSYLCVFM